MDKKMESDSNVCWVFRLYVAGAAPYSQRALVTIRSIGQEFLGGNFRLEIVNVLENPTQALQDGILATPTLVKLSPEPLVRLIGDLSDRSRVLVALGISDQ